MTSLLKAESAPFGSARADDDARQAQRAAVELAAPAWQSSMSSSATRLWVP